MGRIVLQRGREVGHIGARIILSACLLAFDLVLFHVLKLNLKFFCLSSWYRI